MNLDNLTHTSGEWLRGSGPESDIVISSRIRLARNLAAFPFTNRASGYQKAEIETLLRDRISKLELSPRLGYVNVPTLSTLDRQMLVDPRVKGTITVYNDKPQPLAEAYRNYLSALRGLGFTVVESGGFLKVVPEADAKLQTGVVSVGTPSAGKT